MYVKYWDKKYYLSRAYWLDCANCTVYEFVTNDGDIYTVEVKVNESLASKEMLIID